jgi:hypothetical protein
VWLSYADAVPPASLLLASLFVYASLQAGIGIAPEVRALSQPLQRRHPLRAVRLFHRECF